MWFVTMHAQNTEKTMSHYFGIFYRAPEQWDFIHQTFPKGFENTPGYPEYREEALSTVDAILAIESHEKEIAGEGYVIDDMRILVPDYIREAVIRLLEEDRGGS
jgi:hypothetical protein